jgi:effector-binding domain-containing protein
MPSTAPAFTATIREVQPQPYLGMRVRAAIGEIGPAVQTGYAALYERLAKTHGRPAGPPFLIAQVPTGGFLDAELGAPCATPPEPGDGFESGTLPGGKVAVTVHRGSYESLSEIYQRLAEWIGAHGLSMAGPPREVYLTPPGAKPITEVVWPVR